MIDYVDVPIRCPACEANFEIQRRAHATSIGETTEFRPLMREESENDIVTCPECGYTDWQGNMTGESAIESVPEEVRQELQEVVESLGDPASWSLSTRYEVAARLAARAGRPPGVLAQFQLWVAWSAEDAGDSEVAGMWRKRAAETLLGALDHGDVGSEDTLPVTYLAGEMLRRVGDVERARDLFDQVKTKARKNDPQTRRLVRLAEIQARDPFNVLPGWF